ncbi:MAG TPA: spherulation-specific family 4 protein [Candidatus Saccharimonadales bacterium]
MRKKITSIINGLTVISLLTLWFVLPQTAQAVTNQSLAVPLFTAPDKGSFWDDVRNVGASSAPFVVANQNNGPGTAVSPAYAAAIAKNDAVGVKTLGYVQTNYQSRPYKEVVSDIDNWYRFYPGTKGIMVDLVKEGGAAEVCYVSALYSHIKRTHPNDLVVLNPGTHLSTVYEPYGDIFVTASTDYASYQSWVPQYRSFEDVAENQNRFWHIVHSVPADQYRAAFDEVRSNNAGWAFLTDKTLPTPFKATPSFWQSEASDVGALPASSIPNRGITSLPRGCISLSASADNLVDTTIARQSKTNTTITVNNISSMYDSEPITALQVMSIPKGTTLTALSAPDWTCDVSGKTCSFARMIAAGTSPPKVTAALTADCNYSGGDATVRLTNYTGNRWDVKVPVRAPFGCDAASAAAKLNSDTSGQVLTLTTQSVETTPENSPLGGVKKTPEIITDTRGDQGVSFVVIIAVILVGLLLIALVVWVIWLVYRRNRYRVKI